MRADEAERWVEMGRSAGKWRQSIQSIFKNSPLIFLLLLVWLPIPSISHIICDDEWNQQTCRSLLALMVSHYAISHAGKSDALLSAFTTKWRAEKQFLYKRYPLTFTPCQKLKKTCVRDYHVTSSICQSCSGCINTKAGQTVMILMWCVITVIIKLLSLIYLCSFVLFSVVFLHWISQKSHVSQTLCDCDILFSAVLLFSLSPYFLLFHVLPILLIQR